MAFSSPDIIMVFKSRRMKWACRVARMGEIRRAYTGLVGEVKGTTPRGDLEVDVY
jgi:hypothetical protein